jgi:hypothetical protein
MSDTCITYYTQYTQLDPPVRQIGLQGPTGPNDPTPGGTWITNELANEYDCIGLVYYDSDGVTLLPTPRYATLDELKSSWQGGGCVALFKSMALGFGTSNNDTFSPLGFRYVQDDMSFLFSRYFNHDISTSISGPTGTVGKTSYIPLTQVAPIYPQIYENTWIGSEFNLSVPGEQGYDTFVDTLLDVCRQIPGVCQPVQEFMCNQCTRSEILQTKALSDFCGCVAPVAQNEYYAGSINTFAPACDPICNKISTVKLVDPATGYLQQCTASVCVIDNVVINAIDSQGVAPTFTQVCPSCVNGGNCLCIVDATFENTVTSIQGEDGLPINTAARFTQYCPNSQCFVNDPQSGSFNPVACEQTLSKKLLERSGIEGPPVKFPWWLLIIFGLILFVALIIIISYRYQVNNVKVYEYYPGRKYKSAF